MFACFFRCFARHANPWFSTSTVNLKQNFLYDPSSCLLSKLYANESARPRTLCADYVVKTLFQAVKINKPQHGLPVWCFFMYLPVTGAHGSMTLLQRMLNKATYTNLHPVLLLILDHTPQSVRLHTLFAEHSVRNLMLLISQCVILGRNARVQSRSFHFKQGELQHFPCGI